MISFFLVLLCDVELFLTLLREFFFKSLVNVYKHIRSHYLTLMSCFLGDCVLYVTQRKVFFYFYSFVFCFVTRFLMYFLLYFATYKIHRFINQSFFFFPLKLFYPLLFFLSLLIFYFSSLLFLVGRPFFLSSFFFLLGCPSVALYSCLSTSSSNMSSFFSFFFLCIRMTAYFLFAIPFFFSSLFFSLLLLFFFFWKIHAYRRRYFYYTNIYICVYNRLKNWAILFMGLLNLGGFYSINYTVEGF